MLALLLAAMFGLGALVVVGLARHLRAVRAGRARPRSTATLFQIAVAGIVLAVGLPIGAYLGYLAWDRQANYAGVAAEVVRVEPICLLATRGHRGGETRGEPMDCLLARSHLQRPEYIGNWVVQLRRITFGFVSPADGQRHEAFLDVESSYRPVRSGEMVRILAHERQPERIALP